MCCEYFRESKLFCQNIQSRSCVRNFHQMQMNEFEVCVTTNDMPYSSILHKVWSEWKRHTTISDRKIVRTKRKTCFIVAQHTWVSYNSWPISTSVSIQYFHGYSRICGSSDDTIFEFIHKYMRWYYAFRAQKIPFRTNDTSWQQQQQHKT